VLSTLAIDGTPSTKTAMAALQAVSGAKNILVVLSAEDVLGWKSLRNVPEVHLITSGQLNTYDVLISDDVVFTRQALDEFVATSRRTAKASAVAVDAAAPTTGRHAAADEAVTLSQESPAQAEDQTVAADDITADDVAADDVTAADITEEDAT
jgi:large subunit ribosomal protein L4